MDTNIHLCETNDTITLSNNKFQIMSFLMNAINDGWTVRKTSDSYIFSKKHKNKREIFSEDYLSRFIQTSSDLSSILY